LRNAMPELVKGLGVNLTAQLTQRWQKFERRGMHELQYGSTSRRLQAIGRPLVVASLGAVSAMGLRKLVRRLRRKTQ
jgi:hypothetical protein